MYDGVLKMGMSGGGAKGEYRVVILQGEVTISMWEGWIDGRMGVPR